MGLNEYALAKKHLEAAVAVMTKQLGEFDEKTVLAKRELVVLYCNIGEAKKGIELLRPAAERYAKIKAPNDPDLYGLQSLLAMAYMTAGQLDESEALCKTVIAVLGERADTEGVSSTLMSIHTRRGDTPKALELCRRIWETNVKILGRDNAHTVAMEHRLAALCAQTKDYDEAEAHMLSAIEGFKKTQGEDSLPALYAQRDLADIYKESNQSVRAAAALNDLLPEAVKKLGDDHELTKSVRQRLSEMKK